MSPLIFVAIRTGMPALGDQLQATNQGTHVLSENVGKDDDSRPPLANKERS